MKTKTQTLTAARVRQVLNYEAGTGVFTWRAGPRVGLVAGTKHRTGYLFVKVDGVTHLAHRLAWLHANGKWPPDLDHRNLDKADNRLSNLRECDDSTNQANCALRPTNTSGKKGVCWNRAVGKWQAQIKRNGRSLYLGLFEDLDKAAAVYEAAAKAQFGQFARAA